MIIKIFQLCLLFALVTFDSNAQAVRQDILLRNDWRTIFAEKELTGVEKSSFDDHTWRHVDVPHNWESYEGYRRLRHGNKHGTAWYRNKFTMDEINASNRYFLWFEGAGSYATVWVNGKKAGYHAGGRTSFTIDITELLNKKGANVIAVKADHPVNIQDLPWVCGGCSEEVGFSEGSQPLGIFRPVHLIITRDVRVQPFGIHAWNDTTVSESEASVFISAEIRNYSTKKRNVTIVHRLLDVSGKTAGQVKEVKQLEAGEEIVITHPSFVVTNPHLWSVDDPYLYTIVSEITEKGKLIDRTSTTYGIRWIKWGVTKGGANRFYLNGRPVFINGTAEYEHMMGKSHAFTDQQIKARALQIQAAGFNAFRDAHQPHNLRYQHCWDSLGLLSWTQFSSHIWFDLPAFKENFKTLLKEWVKERRNSPSLVLWGLQNESHIPEAFARECTDIIREMDPTTSIQRKVTTCNGGEGTDWNVPQNWSGTYGGDPNTYATDIQRQALVGEYGGWRSLDVHQNALSFEQLHSQEEWNGILETKVRLAESVRDQCSGHFQWLFSSHENPGRVQGGEGFREIDRVGPVNYKGLFTSWGEPLDAFYMYRANYVSKEHEPMVYIGSHTWADRWITAGVKDSLVIYSNCDSVELFNDIDNLSLGIKVNRGKGTHFQWDRVQVDYNVLNAIGYVHGKVAARDGIILKYLPPPPNFHKLLDKEEVTASQQNLHYLYRVNCGGPEYVDKNGNTWMADVHKTSEQTWGSRSWTDRMEDMPSYFASQRSMHDPVKGTQSWPLFQTFRYGMDQLQYDFPVPDGEYTVELYFVEPWYGTGGGMNCAGWRQFDVAINGNTVLRDLDIWKEAGHDGALKKVVRVKIAGGKLSVSFPKVNAGQAIISAIAIASDGPSPAAPPSPLVVENLFVYDSSGMDKWSVQTWLDNGDQQYTDSGAAFVHLPARLFAATWIRTPLHVSSTDSSVAEFILTEEADVLIGCSAEAKEVGGWLSDYENTQERFYNNHGQSFHLYRKRFTKGGKVLLGKPVDSLGMYSVFVLPVNSMQPAVDLRTAISYPAEKALVTEGIKPDKILDRDCITFSSGKGTVSWDISLGVANQYALLLRYYHNKDHALQGNLKVLAEDGTMLHEEPIHFPVPGESKWKVVHASTGTMINAGNYRIILEGIREEGLSIRSLEVQ